MITVGVLAERSLESAEVSVIFAAGLRECTFTVSEAAPVRVGQETVFTVSSARLSTDEFACPMPFETTEILVSLWDVSGPSLPPLLTRQFSYTYRFAPQN